MLNKIRFYVCLLVMGLITNPALSATLPKDIGDIDLSAFIRFDYQMQSNSKDLRKTGGDLKFNVFGVAIKGDKEDFFYDAEYRFYHNMDTLQHGWLGYRIGNTSNIKGGYLQVPFGNYPYGTYTWYGNLLTNFGFNDTQHLGVQWEFKPDDKPLEAQVAFFKSTNLRGYTDADTYGSTVVGGDGGGGFIEQQNSAQNEIDTRLAYRFNSARTKGNISLSAKGGQLYNHTTKNTGSYWALALAGTLDVGYWNFMANVTPYSFSPKNPNGVTKDTIQMGFLGFKYLMPSKGMLYELGAMRTIKLGWKYLDTISIYNDFSYLEKKKGTEYNFRKFTQTGNLKDVALNDTGVVATMGPFSTQFDFYVGRNTGFMGVGSNNDKWENRVEWAFIFNFK